LIARGTNAQIHVGLDERVKAVSRSQVRDIGNPQRSVWPMRIKAYREAHSRRGCERAIFVTRKSLKSLAAQNVNSPFLCNIRAATLRHLEVV
jgi:hypothetical protein